MRISLILFVIILTWGSLEAAVPTVDSHNAVNGIGIYDNITINFSEIIYDAASSPVTSTMLNGGFAKLKLDNASGQDVAFSASIASQRDITIDPDVYLIWGQTYYVEIGIVEGIGEDETPEVTSFTFTAANQVEPSLSNVVFSSNNPNLTSTDNTPEDLYTSLRPYVDNITLAFDSPGVKDNDDTDDDALVFTRTETGTTNTETLVEGTDYNWQYNAGQIVVSILGNANLLYGHDYEITLSNIQSNEDAVNVASSDIVYSFQTQSVPPISFNGPNSTPVHNNTAVDPYITDKEIVIDFDTDIREVSGTTNVVLSGDLFDAGGTTGYDVSYPNDRDDKVIITLRAGSYLNYGTTYSVTITDVAYDDPSVGNGNEIDVLSGEVNYTFTTLVSEPSLNGAGSDPIDGDQTVSPYVGTVTMAFNTPQGDGLTGANENEMYPTNNRKVVPYRQPNGDQTGEVALTYGVSNDYTYVYNSDGEIELTFHNDLVYDMQYQIRMNQLQADEIIDNFNNTEIEYTFKTGVAEPPSYDDAITYVFDDTDPANGSQISISPYLDQFHLTFDKDIKVGDVAPNITISQRQPDNSYTDTGISLTSTVPNSDDAIEGNNLILELDMADGVNLDYSSDYRISVNGIYSDENIDNVMTIAATIDFSTKDPQVLNTTASTFLEDDSPITGTLNITPYADELQVTFNQDISIDMATVSITCDDCSDSSEPVLVIGDLSVSDDELTVDLSPDGNLQYGESYTITLTNIRVDEPIQNIIASPLVVTFSTVTAVSPEVVAVNSQPVSPSLTGVSPYNQVLTFTFNNDGVEDNGSDDVITVSGTTDTPSFTSTYNGSNQIVITFDAPLAFGETYTVNMSNIKSNEDIDNIASAVTPYVFTTTGVEPSLAVVSGAGQSLCANIDSETISWNIAEGHEGNFHDDPTYVFAETIIFGIRKIGEAGPADDFIFSNNGTITNLTTGTFDIADDDLDIDNVGPGPVTSDQFFRVLIDPSGGISGNAVDILRVSGVTVRYTQASISPAAAGAYEIYVVSRTLPFSGIEVGDPVATISLTGEDDQPVLERTDSRSGDDNVCAGEEITFSVVGADPATRFFYFINNAQQGTVATSTFSTTALVDGDAVTAQTDGVCPSISEPIDINVIDIPSEDITFVVDFKEDDRTDLEDIISQSEVPIGNLFDSLTLRAFFGDTELTEGNFVDFYTINPPLLFEYDGDWLWSPRRAWEFEDSPAVYEVFFEQQCFLEASDDAAGFRFSVYDQENADQLSSRAITQATICDNQEDSVAIEWVPAQVLGDQISSYSMVGNVDGLITSYIDEDGVTERFSIHPSVAAGQSFVTITITYELVGSTAGERQIEQNLSVALPVEVKISDAATSDTLKAAYCNFDQEVDLVVNSNRIGESLVYSILDLDVPTAEYDTIGQLSRLFFESVPAGGVDNVQIKTSNYLPPNENGYGIKVEYKTLLNCASSFDTTLVVHPLPAEIDSITIAECIGAGIEGVIEPIDLRPTDTDSISNYNLVWSLDNLVRDTTWIYNSRIPDGLVGETILNLQMLDWGTGCLGEKSDVVVKVGDLPEAAFDYTITSDQKLWLEDKSISASRPEDQIAQWNWKIDNEDQDELERTVPLTTIYDTLQLSDGGVDTLSLIVTTELGCSDTLEQVITMPSYADQSNNSYSTNFEGSHNWVATAQNENTASETAQNSTWELKEYNGLQSAWHAAGNNEYSWVESPLIDISQWTAPVLSMDVHYDTPDLEGVVIQYRVVGETPDQNGEWTQVGGANTGSIPYNSGGISAGPGGQITGWTGVSEGLNNGWLTPAFDISDVRVAARSVAEIAGRSLNTDLYVQFRVAYATLDITTGNSERTGVAFDNFSVYNKERKIFIEHYTNLNFPRFDEERQKVNAFVEERYNTEDPDIVYVQFHTPNGGPDALNMMYTGERNSHHALREAPRRGLTFINQVQHEMGTFETDAVDLYGRETVQAPAFDLELSFDRENYQPGDYLQVSASAIRNSVSRITLDTASKELLNILQLAVVEKEVEYNGELHHNVLVTLLPSFGKYSKWADWGQELGEPIVIESEGWQIPVDAEPNRFALVAWIEKTRVNPYSSFNGVYMSREIFQAKELDIDIPLFASTPITSVKTLSTQGIKYYPVPVRDELHIELSEITLPNTGWSVMTLTGQAVLKGNWQVSSQSQIIDMQTLDRGIYLLQIEGYDKPIRISKN